MKKHTGQCFLIMWKATHKNSAHLKEESNSGAKKSLRLVMPSPCNCISK